MGSYTSSATYFPSQTAQGPNRHTKAMQSALTRCLNVGWDAHSHTDQSGRIGAGMKRNLLSSRMLEKGSGFSVTS